MIGGDVYIGDLLANLDVTSPLVHTKQAVIESGQFLRAAWIAEAQKDASTGSYVQGIQDLDVLEDGISVQVVNTAPHAAAVEEGHGGFHLPSAINWGASKKKRVSAKGLFYLIIPFRHYTPAGPNSGRTRMAERQMMPSPIYRKASKLAPSFHLGEGRYRWGGRLSLPKGNREGQRHAPTMHSAALGRDVVNFKPHWTTSKFQGMVRFPQIGPAKEGADPKTSSTYMTFRVLIQGSPKWNIPPLEGKHYLDRVLSPENVEAVRQRVAEGVVRDFFAFRGGPL